MSLDDNKALRRLAAAVLLTAVEDYRQPRRAARETGHGSERETRNECARFLVSNSPWHMVLGLHPDRAARWLRKEIEGKRV